MSIFDTRPRIQDRDFRQLSGDSVTLSGETNISGSFRYIPGATNGYVMTSDASGYVSWQSPSGISADTNTYTTGGTLTGASLVLGLNNGSTASPIDLSALSGSSSPFEYADVATFSIKPIGANSIDGSSTRSTIGGGELNDIETSPKSGIFVGNSSYIHNSSYSVIGGGSSNAITGNSFNTIGGGRLNTVQTSTHTSIVGGYQNMALSSNRCVIGGGTLNDLTNSGYSLIGGGAGNYIRSGNYCSILGGAAHYINGSFSDAGYGVIGGGKNNAISGSTYCSVAGGANNIARHDNSHIIGSNITSIQSDTTHVEGLNISTLGTGTSINNLGIDVLGNVVPGTAGGGVGVTIDPFQDEGNVASISWDVSGTSTNYEATLTGNTTLTMSNVRNGDYGTLIVTQDGTGGHSLTFGAGTHKVVNGGAGVPTITGTANAIDILSFVYNGSTFYWTVGNDYT